VTGPEYLTCNKITGLLSDAQCQRYAVELLLIQAPGEEYWNVRARCDQHCATDDIPVLRRVSPGVRFMIVPLGSVEVQT
jgi:hypothetical protein